METVNKVVDAGYKAIWGEGEQTANEQSTASSSQPTASTGITGIATVDKVVEAGKKAIWGENAEKSQETSQLHSEEPVAGKLGLGTATDPYDAGNRDDQYEAPPVEAGGLPTSMPVSEQRDVAKTETNLNTSGSSTGSNAAATTTSQDPKPSATGLRPDPAQPGNAADSTARAVSDGGPGQTLKSTSEPFEEETNKLAKDLQNVNMDDNKPKVHTVNGGIAVSRPNQIVDSKKSDSPEKADSKENSVSSSPSAPSSSAGDGHDQQKGQKTKTSKLEKVKNKLHIGHSHKSSH